MTSPERKFDANLARSLTDLEKNRPELSAQEGSGPREITHTTEPELAEEERHAKIDEYISQTEAHLQHSVTVAQTEYRKAVECMNKNDVYSKQFSQAWDLMVAQQSYLASLENYATGAVQNAGGTKEQTARMEEIRKRITDAKIELEERIKGASRVVIDGGGYYDRYKPGHHTNSDARAAENRPKNILDVDESAIPKITNMEKKFIQQAKEKELNKGKDWKQLEGTRVAPKKKSFWKRLFGRE